MHRIFFLFAALVVASMTSGCAPEPTYEYYVMPKGNFEGVSQLDVDLVLDDLNDPPPVVPAPLVGLLDVLRNAGVKRATSAMYYLESGTSVSFIDVSILEYQTEEAAKASLRKRFSGVAAEDYDELPDLGVLAYRYKKNIINFVQGPTAITLTSFKSDTQLRPFAARYAEWLAGLNGRSGSGTGEH